ncbi:MAG: S8 family serine peptidase, partial [Pseudohongiellaceae bacterium]
LASRLPERLTVADGAGNQAFVEIALTPDIRVIEYQWVMLVDSGQREQLQTQAPELMEFLTDTQPFTASDSEILTFTVPPDLDRDDNVLQLLPEALRDFIDRNHVYSAQAEGGNDELVGKGFLELSMRPVCEAPLGIGIIDSAVNTGHSAFSAMAGRGTGFVTRNFLDELVKQPAGHGTAVAGVLVGKGEYLQPLVPGATIYNAAVIYSQDDYHQGATVVHLLEALDWMHGQPQVRIINMSLAGPPNRLLQQGIEAIVSGGKTVVAAVGNEGPHAPSQYPAAYDSVIGVTAIALDRSIYRWANQGDYVDFAALGVSVPTARGDGSFGRESGTSIAAPVVSAFLACALLDHHSTEAALAALKSQLIDLGDPGHDPIFGHGLLHP